MRGSIVELVPEAHGSEEFLRGRRRRDTTQADERRPSNSFRTYWRVGCDCRVGRACPRIQGPPQEHGATVRTGRTRHSPSRRRIRLAPPVHLPGADFRSHRCARRSPPRGSRLQESALRGCLPVRCRESHPVAGHDPVRARDKGGNRPPRCCRTPHGGLLGQGHSVHPDAPGRGLEPRRPDVAGGGIPDGRRLRDPPGGRRNPRPRGGTLLIPAPSSVPAGLTACRIPPIGLGGQTDRGPPISASSV